MLMCGRYVAPDVGDLERHWHLGRHNNNWATRLYNVAPTTQVPMLGLNDQGLIEVYAARWGFIPSWWSKPKPPNLTFNARSEEAHQKPMWRQALKGARCLMPALGWYEWCETEPVKKRKR